MTSFCVLALLTIQSVVVVVRVFLKRPNHKFESCSDKETGRSKLHDQ